MLGQNELFRRHALGSFRRARADVTADPAMILWLNRNENRAGAPNENYARELMELFTLGADRGAYTEDDVRELARALTGWDNDWSAELGSHNFRFDADRHDAGTKTVFGKTGNFDWQDACRLCVEHPLHPTFLVEKLWSYFIPTPPTTRTAQALEQAYVERRLRRSARRRGDPAAPAALRGPADGQAAGRVHRRPAAGARPRVDTDAWTWLAERAGPAAVLPAERRGLGRRALARHRHAARPLGVAATRSTTASSRRSRSTSYAPTETPEAGGRRALTSGATRR